MAGVALLLLAVAWRDARAGDPGHVAPTWPTDSFLSLAPRGSTLVLVAHPHCACTPASLDELEAVLNAVREPVRAYVLVVRPAGAPPGFEDGPVWDRARHLSGAVPVLDLEAQEAGLFGVVTSGHVMAYDAAGRLLFAGGITAAKGCAGDNPARQRLIRVLSGGDPRLEAPTPVYGCRLNRCDLTGAAPLTSRSLPGAGSPR